MCISGPNPNFQISIMAVRARPPSEMHLLTRIKEEFCLVLNKSLYLYFPFGYQMSEKYLPEKPVRLIKENLSCIILYYINKLLST